MSWNDCLYEYHKKYGGQLLAGREDDGLLVFTWEDRPLAVDLYGSSGRAGTVCFVRARIPVTLAKPYRLAIGEENRWSDGVNSVLKAVPKLPSLAALPADFGFPEVTKKRLIRSNNHPFTKLVLGSLELRNALTACPEDRVEVLPGPGGEGLHQVIVTTGRAVNALAGDGSWYLGEFDRAGAGSDQARPDRRIQEEFFPRMDRFLDLCKTAYLAVTRWQM